jgi:leader peptidase (prepilin peptidase)/N-methyltransferase
MAAIVISDLQRLRIPDTLVLLTALTGFIWQWLLARETGESLAGAAFMAGLQMLVCGGSLLLLREVYYRLRGHDGMGLGDVKLAAAAGTWIAWDMFAMAALLASILALLAVGMVAIRKGWPRERRIAFAAYLAPAIWIVWVVGRIA